MYVSKWNIFWLTLIYLLCSNSFFQRVFIFINIFNIHDVFIKLFTPCVNIEDSVFILLHHSIAEVVKMESTKREKRLKQDLFRSDLFSALWVFMRSLLGLNRTPQFSLTRVTHIGRNGVLNREPRFRLLVVSSSFSQIRKPISFLSVMPTCSPPS